MLSRAILDPDSLPNAGRRWDAAILGLLVVLLAFAPAAFGAVEAWSHLIVIAMAAAIGIATTLRVIFDREFRPTWTWLYVPLALFIGLTVLQIVPLPASLVRILSQETVDVRQDLLDETILHTTLSFYPRSTTEHLRLVLVGTTVFAVVASLIRTPRQVKLLLLCVFIIGCAEALVALAQVASASEQIYWSIPAGGGIATAGTFVNYSNFSQFMNLSLGAGIALLLVELRDERRNEARGGNWHRPLTLVNWEKHGLLLLGIILCAISILTSMSRNGAISMFIAAALVGAALYRRGALNWRGWLLGAVPLAVLVVLLVVGFDLVYERLATLQDARYFEDRWELTLATLRAWQQYPIWGTGLGTHAYVIPMFDTSAIPSLAGHADNDYAQLLEEMGLVGAALVLAFLIGVGAVIGRLAVRGRSASSAAAFGLAFGLIAVAIHSASDFGQRLPANLCLSAATCGLLVAIARMERRRAAARQGELPAAAPSSWNRAGVAIASIAALVLLWGWAGRDAYAAFLGERWWSAALATEAMIRNEPDQATDDDYRDLLAMASAAFESDPANVEYGHWLNSFRWEAISRTVDPDTGQAVLHADVLPLVHQIADSLADVRRICPTFGPPYALEGQLRLLVLQQESGATLIRKGVRLAAYDAPTCLAAGHLAVREGKLEEAQRLLTRAVELQPRYFNQVVAIYLEEAHRPDLARSLAGDDYWRLAQLAEACAAVPQYAHLAGEIQEAATDALRRGAAGGTASPAELVALARVENAAGNTQAAIGHYRAALNQDYRRVDWRLELARILAAVDELDKAIDEVRLSLRLRPHYAPAAKLLEELISRREAMRE